MARPYPRGGARAQVPWSVAFWMTTGTIGCSLSAVGIFEIRSTTSWPLVTFPTSAYCGGRPASAAVTTKNWLPDVPDGSVAVFAIATVYFVYLRLAGSFSRTE